MTALAYPLLAAIGMVVSAYLWEHARSAETRVLPGWNTIFVGALIGMAVGAILGFALAEGLWTAPPHLGLGAFLLHAFRGKTVVGGLLGAYAGVELAKRRVGHAQPTGDAFALVAPMSLMLGRAGCLIAGCCGGIALEPAWFTITDAHGVARWPAAWIELAFNALFLAFIATWTLRRRSRPHASRLDGQLFHLYLIAYGVFRFGHEMLRDTPRIAHGLSGYQVLALALVALGAARGLARDERVVAKAQAQ